MPDYKIPNLPGARAFKEETADFWEIQSICNPDLFISQTQISKIISMELDEIRHEGIDSEDDILNEGDENRTGLEDVFIELQRRTKYTCNKYPFNFGKYSMKIIEQPSLIKNVYLFLLLCTRLNMKTQKVHNGIDGTLLFERLCAHVAKNYFGKSSQSLVFGTAGEGSFEKKVRDLIKKIGEGQAFRNPNKNKPTKRDDSLDIVVWKEFSDKRVGKLIGFGQCKTGTTTWKDDIHRLKPIDFCGSWFDEQPILYPIPLVFICDTMNEDLNFYNVQKGYLIFNRFRILEYANEKISEDVKQDLSSWLDGALGLLKIRN